MIAIKKVSKLFKTSKKESITAVDGVSLHIEKGEIFGIIGYSGAGKSTLIRMLNLLERPTVGLISVNGVDLSTLSERQLRIRRQKIGMIFQHFNLLWSRTVKENIQFPLEIARVPKKEREKRVLELIELVGLQGKENEYPSQLSGGQKQRVGIARAIANDPEVLLCDEATSALDPKTTDSILELLSSINDKLGLTIVLITHEMHVIRKICDRVAVMEEGRVVELGTVLNVFQRPQQEMTKEFVKQVNNPDEAIDLLSEADIKGTIEHGEIIKCHFLGRTTNQPLISQLVKKYNIDVNILQGKINRLKNAPYGTMYLHLTGESEIIESGIEYLRQQGVEVEVVQR